MPEVTVPPRRRRRPALSCVECRRRKVKCDRNAPCSHCLQLKNTVCTYPVSHTPVVNNRRIAPKASPTSLLVDDHPGILGAPELAPLGFETPSVEAGSLSQEPLDLEDGSYSGRESWESTPVGTSDGSPSEKNIQNLVSRTKSLGKDRPTSPSINKKHGGAMAPVCVNFVPFEGGIVQDGNSHNLQTNSTPTQDLKGPLHKTQFFGRSHWMYTFDMINQICRFKEQEDSPDYKDVGEAFEKCKRMVAASKIGRHIKEQVNHVFKDYIPPREIADKLVSLYLRTCESTYRILHIPYFKQEYANYWNDPASASTASAVRILLVIAIGTCFYQGEGAEELRSNAQQWICSAQSWAIPPFDKGQLSISGIQIYCLILLARQTNAVGVDLIWYESGTLLRMAFSMGFHRDPKYFPKLSIFAAEIRRRIWATVMEMAIQTSLDTGMPPLITFSDFDTEPPSNIDDEDISESTTVIPSPKPINVYTQTSIQLTLLKSLRIRLEIVQLVNNFHSELSYDVVLRFGQEITKACNDASRLTKSYATSLPQPTALQSNLLDILVRRFLLEVHRPFFVRSQIDPRYYFSRKVCLEAALVILFHSGAKDLPPDDGSQTLDDYTLLKMVGGGFLKNNLFYASSIIIVELILQLEEDISSGLPPTFQIRAAREPLYQAVNDMATLVTERLRVGDNDAKGPIMFTAAAAHIHALTDGVPTEPAVIKATQQTIKQCLEVVRKRTQPTPCESGIHSLPEASLTERSANMEGPGIGFDSLTQDANMDFGILDENMDFEILDSWLFTGWDAN